MIKATYTLDPATIRKLEDIARQRGVSTSQALKDVVRLASVNGGKGPGHALEALDRLQDLLKLTSSKARSWAYRSRAERRTSSSRRLARKR